MQMNHAAFARSPALRVSLKRGIARQMADRAAPDIERGGCGNLNSRDKWIFRATAA